MVSFGRKRSTVVFQQPDARRVRRLPMPAFYKGLLLVATCLITAYLIAPSMPSTIPAYQIGDIADQNIRATEDVLVEDTASTANKKLENEEKTPSVYDFDANAAREAEQRLDAIFGEWRRLSESPAAKIAGEEQRERFKEYLGISIPDAHYATLVKQGFADAVVDAILALIRRPLGERIVADRSLLRGERVRGMIIRTVQTQEETFVADLSSLRDAEEVKREMRLDAAERLQAMPQQLANAVLEIAGGLIRPTLTFNLNETESRKLAARAQTNPVYFRLKKGEMIIREGDRVTEEASLKLQALNKLKKEGSPLIFTLGIFILVLIVISLFYAFSPINIRRFNLEGKDYVLLSLVLIGMVLIINFSLFLSAALSKAFAFLPSHSLLYAPPFALGAIIVAVVLNGELAAMFSVVLAIIAGVMLDIQLKFFIYPFMGSIVAAQQVVLYKERSTLIRAGFIAGVVNILLILCFAIVRKSFFQPEVLFDVCCGLLGGILTGVIATGLVPLIEIAFDYTTNIKLLELADLNQPLLKELSMKAPGTYQHSIMVGNLADAAADTVGANSLLVRVSSYYHDIGKIRMASYFAENQLQGENKHEKLTPSMSSLIILSHVKDGGELAREHRLGGAIRDIIRQHHGNSIISFFYQKARNTQDPGYETVSDKDFRYPGPKPQTKEAALVMLADAVEAASKTLVEPSLPRIQGMVQKIINGIFIDGQLDECELTLKNLHAIANCFNRVLAGGVFHQRVEYPAPKIDEGGSKRKTNGKDKKQSEADKDKPKVDKGAGERDLKRLGLSKG
jgi:hypothetical protein